jgi:SpoVK/Ycf46/Vps4 family AAA+-type ATPase
LIEQAGARGILVIATSNRLESIDPALVRRGRFDHVVEVKPPDETAVKAILEALLEQRPAAAGINTSELARKLTRRPISDLRWLVDDAARAAVRANKSQIDDFCLFGALKRLERAKRQI